jgi:hypothetical protein
VSGPLPRPIGGVPARHLVLAVMNRWNRPMVYAKEFPLAALLICSGWLTCCATAPVVRQRNETVTTASAVKRSLRTIYIGSKVRIRWQRDLTFAAAQVRMSGKQPVAASPTPIPECRHWPMKEHSSLTREWPVTGADPTPERPTDGACERRFVAQAVSKLEI